MTIVDLSTLSDADWLRHVTRGKRLPVREVLTNQKYQNTPDGRTYAKLWLTVRLRSSPEKPWSRASRTDELTRLGTLRFREVALLIFDYSAFGFGFELTLCRLRSGCLSFVLHHRTKGCIRFSEFNSRHPIPMVALWRHSLNHSYRRFQGGPG
jgi:hypothetical protein